MGMSARFGVRCKDPMFAMMGGHIVVRIFRSIAPVFLALFVVACGGKSANPVVSYQPGDEKRSCEGLKSEIALNEAEIAKLVPYDDATGKNVALGVTGFFLIIPWFFMDFKEGEAIEIQALRRRNQWLREVASDKDCSLPPPTVVFEEKPEEPKTE